VATAPESSKARVAAPELGRDWGRLALVASLVLLFLAIVLRIAVFGLVSVKTGSMQPAIRPGSTWLYLKYAEPELGDMVVVELPWEPGVLHVKRLVATGPGEVELVDGRLYVDGAPVFVDRDVDVPWLDETCTSRFGRGHEEIYGGSHVSVLGGGDHARTQLLAGEIWLLGDRRGRSEDSGQWGPVTYNAVRGKVWGPVLSGEACE
jgi:signal peptidase I